MSRTLAEFHDYEGMVEAIRARVRELEIAGEAFDEYAGLPQGYLSKLIGAKPVRRISHVSMGPLFEALGITGLLVENEAGTDRLKKRLRPRNKSFVRTTYTHRVITDRTWRQLQKLGRAARWQKYTPEQRREIMRKLARRRWVK